MKRKRIAMGLDRDSEDPWPSARTGALVSQRPLPPASAPQESQAADTNRKSQHMQPQSIAATHHPRRKQRTMPSPDSISRVAALEQPSSEPPVQLHQLSQQKHAQSTADNSPAKANIAVALTVCVESGSPIAAIKPSAATAQAPIPCSPSSSSDGYPIQHMDLETVDLTIDTDTEDEVNDAADVASAVPAATSPQKQAAAALASNTTAANPDSSSSYRTASSGSGAQTKSDTESEEFSSPAQSAGDCSPAALQAPTAAEQAALASAAADTDNSTCIRNGDDSSSDSADSSGSDDVSSASSSESEGSGSSVSSDSSSVDDDADADWTPSKPVRSASTIGSLAPDASTAAIPAQASPPGDTAGKKAAAVETVQQLTPPNAAAGKQQHQQQEEQTPVLSEQQRTKASTGCKSPGTPQIMLLPAGITSSCSSVLVAAAAAPCQQQQCMREQQGSGTGAKGRRVLAEVQVGQDRGLTTPPSNKQQQQQQQQQSWQQQDKRVPADKAVVLTKDTVKSSGTAAAATAGPSTPELVKQQHTPQQQKQQQGSLQDVLDIIQGRDTHQLQQLPTNPKPPAAVAAAVYCVASPPLQQQQQAVRAATAAAVPRAANRCSSSISSWAGPAAVSTMPQLRGMSLLSPVKPPQSGSAAISPAGITSAATAAATPTAPTPAAAAGGGGSGHPVAARNFPAPPLSDIRTIAYVRAPRQQSLSYGRLAGTAKKARELSAKAYHDAAAAAYSSGSNEHWNSHGPSVSSNANVNAFLASQLSSTQQPLEGAGTLSIKPTLEQRVGCAYLRMRLTEAAAGGAGWAMLDLAGLVLDTSEEAVEACRQRYATERATLMKCRNPGQVAAEEKKTAAALSWIKEVRMAAAAAAEACVKQGILKRPVAESALPAWQVDNHLASTNQQQQQHRVRFNAKVQVSPAAPQ